MSKIRLLLDRIQIPFLDISLFKLFQIYIAGLFKDKIGRKSAAISWSFVLSIFPFALFLLSILPYFPHYDKLQYYIFDVLMQRIFPGRIESDVMLYVRDNIMPKASGLNKFYILLSLIFAANGTFVLIDAFNEHTEEKLNDVKEYVVAFFITLGFISVVLVALFGLYYSEIVLKLLSPGQHFSWFLENLSKIISYISFPVFYFLLLSLFYWSGTQKIVRFRQALPGALLTTILFILTVFLFSIYIRNFAKYNLLYGSIGTMILLMVWVNVNVYLLLFGNELNLAIRQLRIQKRLNEKLKNTENDYQ